MGAEEAVGAGRELLSEGAATPGSSHLSLCSVRTPPPHTHNLLPVPPPLPSLLIKGSEDQACSEPWEGLKGRTGILLDVWTPEHKGGMEEPKGSPRWVDV